MARILVGSPVCKAACVVNEFLAGLEEADKENNQITYFFVDDNRTEDSSALLNEFSKTHECILKKGREVLEEYGIVLDDVDYDDGRLWHNENLIKITCYKNAMIDYCVKEKFDYLFLIDADIVLDKRTITTLIADNVEIVANVFWSQWVKNGPLTPQRFWIPDVYTQFKNFNVAMTFPEAHEKRMKGYNLMKNPGLYKVEGTGACTLIKRSALEKGVNFTPIYNLEIPGEDRPFCIRAGVAGVDLYMDTKYPVYHIAKEKYVDRVDEFKREGWKWDMCMTIEEEPPKKKKNFISRFILRAAKKIVRDLS